MLGGAVFVYSNPSLCSHFFLLKAFKRGWFRCINVELHIAFSSGFLTHLQDGGRAILIPPPHRISRPPFPQRSPTQTFYFEFSQILIRGLRKVVNIQVVRFSLRIYSCRGERARRQGKLNQGAILMTVRARTRVRIHTAHVHTNGINSPGL